MSSIEKIAATIFEQIRRIDALGAEYWNSRELSRVLITAILEPLLLGPKKRVTIVVIRSQTISLISTKWSPSAPARCGS